MKVCVIFYHKNIFLFKKEWIDKCIMSIKEQTFKDFDVLELNYDQTGKQLFENSIFEHVPLFNHVEAMNYLIQKAKALCYDYVFNVNIDDYYAPNRIEKQLEYLQNYDMVSSDMICIKEKKGQEIILSTCKNSNLNIKEQLLLNNNIIAHPCVAWKISFFDNLKYENEIPAEDLRLWQRAIDKKTMFIIPEFLLYYRIHDNQITQGTIKKNQTLIDQCLADFISCFEHQTHGKMFLSWSDMVRIFKSWWLKFHPEKKIPTDWDLRKTIDATIGDPDPRKGWFIRIRPDYQW
jgi:hypothetical protein